MRILRSNHSKRSLRGARAGMPLFFKLWFAFCALGAVAVIAVTVYAGINLVSFAGDPESLGNYLGAIAAGFEETSK